MEKTPEHRFRTLNEIFKFVDSENVDRFLNKFGDMLKDAIAMREKSVQYAKENGLTFDGLELGEMAWRDTDDENYRTNISIESDDGEVFEVTSTKKDDELKI